MPGCSAPTTCSCVHIQQGPHDQFWLDWQAPNPDFPLTVIRPRRRGIVKPLRSFIKDIRWEHPRTRVIVVMPLWVGGPHWWWQATHHQAARIRAGLITMRDIVVVNLTLSSRPVLRGEEGPPPVPKERIVIVPVGGVTQATLDAVAYVKWTDPSAIHAVHAEMDPEYAARTMKEWNINVPDIPLQVMPNPFRATTPVILDFILDTRAMAPSGTVIEVIVPEFIVPTPFGRMLHNRTASALKTVWLATQM